MSQSAGVVAPASSLYILDASVELESASNDTSVSAMPIAEEIISSPTSLSDVISSLGGLF